MKITVRHFSHEVCRDVTVFAGMEVALAALQILSEPLRRGTSLPLSQLVEESKSGAPGRQPDPKICAKRKSGGLIRAEPPELHFSGFEVQKEYTQTLKLINGSSDVLNIHVIPTQTEHFQTSCSKKCRLIPGLAYTLKVTFCPDEWRYFYDRIRVRYQEEEKLLIPVHAYPVISDLHIPPRIDLPAVPLGQSVCHAIPLRCSCPVDFEFQVYVIEPHKAFSVHPLTGVIPANGEVNISVTFAPLQYETSHITVQLVVSQFNTKPYLCTITGRSAPHLAFSELRKKLSREAAGSAERGKPSPDNVTKPAGSRNKLRSLKQADKSKTLRDQDLNYAPKPPADVCTPAGVAKLLIKDAKKLSSKDLREAMSCGCIGAQDRQLREAVFLKKVQRNVKEEQAVYIKWQTRLGRDPVSNQTRRKIAEEREFALHEYRVKVGDVGPQEDLSAGPPRLFSQRLIHEAGQTCEGAPTFHFYPAFHWQLRRRVLTLFQQAARKVVIQCRANRRLTCLRKLSGGRKNAPSAPKAKVEETDVSKISPDRVFPFAFPVFHDGEDLLAPSRLEPVPVDPIRVTVTTGIPFFKLQVPQHYKLMGYQPVSVWNAFSSYIPTTLARPLCSAPPDEPTSDDPSPQTAIHEALEEEEEEEGATSLSFTAPDALLYPPLANRLRIFNPAPGLQPTKPTPKYLESELEFHLSPKSRCATPDGSMLDAGKDSLTSSLEEGVAEVTPTEDSSSSRASSSPGL